MAHGLDFGRSARVLGGNNGRPDPMVATWPNCSRVARGTRPAPAPKHCHKRSLMASPRATSWRRRVRHSMTLAVNVPKAMRLAGGPLPFAALAWRRLNDAWFESLAYLVDWRRVLGSSVPMRFGIGVGWPPRPLRHPRRHRCRRPCWCSLPRGCLKMSWPATLKRLQDLSVSRRRTGFLSQTLPAAPVCSQALTRRNAVC